MYSNKKNLLELLSLLKAYKIFHIVVAPGSRNSPLNHSFATDPDFTCWPVTDERSAGFFALGLIQKLQQPVAVSCTSGSAVLNLAPAVAEACYQPLPLLILSADRPAAWIGQTDGQTIPQPGIFNQLVKKSVQLPEPVTKEDEWYCNRLINEALTALTHRSKGPVQINIPLSEPLFEYTIEKLPDVRKINCFLQDKQLTDSRFRTRFESFRKRMILVGQRLPDPALTDLLKLLHTQYDCVIVAEHLGNIHAPFIIGNVDPLLYTLTHEEKTQLSPDLLITLEGHIVSKRLKQLLRTAPPQEHWNITPSGEITDLFQCLSDLIETKAETFIQGLLSGESDCRKEEKEYQQHWYTRSASIPQPEVSFSDLYAVGALCRNLPEKVALHLANSSSVRYAQLFSLPPDTQVYCNRGTSGIEGSVSTAVGYSAITDQPVFLLIGDLSFFYDMNGLWNDHLSCNLHILLNNNSAGEIFYALPGLNQSEAINPYIAGNHTSTAQGWAESRGFLYLQATNKEEIEKNMPTFVSGTNTQPVLMEVFSSIESNIHILRNYYKQLSIDN